MQYLVLFLMFGALRLLGATPFTVMLDPGHTPQFPGAVGCRGRAEVYYNDELTQLIERKLSTLPNIRVLITRKPGLEMELAERANLANKAKVDLLLSIHHDSANPKYLVESEVDGQKQYCLSDEFKKRFQTGFSLFVSKKNPHFERSRKFAETIGREMVKLKRPVSDYHTEKLENENRVFINKSLGVYQYDDLIVLKKATVPAVLFEAAVVSDPKDERYIADEKSRDSVSNALVRAIRAMASRKSVE